MCVTVKFFFFFRNKRKQKDNVLSLISYFLMLLNVENDK